METKKYFLEMNSKMVECENTNRSSRINSFPNESESKEESELILQFKRYDRVSAEEEILLQRVSFSIPKGKVTAFLGVPGNSKTALLESMAGHCAPSHTSDGPLKSRQLLLQSIAPNSMPADKTYGEVYTQDKTGILAKRDVVEWFSRVNYIQASATNYRNMPTYKILCSIAKCFKKTVNDVDAYIDLFRISNTKKRPYIKLLNGEKARAMVIVGLLSNKEFNIWDEPLADLNAEMAEIVLGAIKELNGTSIAAVEKVPEECIKYFDHIILMHNTTIVYSGPASEIKDYFTEKGVVFLDDIFSINYLTYLCHGKSKDDVGAKNVEIFNELASCILKKKSKPEIIEEIASVPSQSKVSFTHVIELFRRMFYFDRKFNGQYLIFSIFIILFILAGFIIFIAYDLMSQVQKGSNKINKYDNVTSLKYLYRLALVKEKRSSDLKNKPVLQGMVNTLLKHLANTAWMLYLQKLFSVVTMGIFIVIVCYHDPCLNPNFYEICKANINSGQITAGDFMAFEIFYTFFLKCTSGWIFQIILYWTAYFFMERSIRQYITISHTVAMALLFLSSVLFGLYSMMLSFWFITLFHSGLLFTVILSYIIVIIHGCVEIYRIQQKEGFYKYSYIEDLMIFTSKENMNHKYLGSIFNYVDFQNRFIMVIANCIRSFPLYVPVNSFVLELSKIELYYNQLRVERKHQKEPSDAVLDMFIKKMHDPLLLDICGDKSDEQEFRSILADVYGNVRPHEILFPAHSLEGISVMHII